MREGADPKALIELRRFLARPFAVHEVDAPAFDRLLSDLYPSGTEAAADAAGSLGFGDDLGHLAAACRAPRICSTRPTTRPRSA